MAIDMPIFSVRVRVRDRAGAVVCLLLWLGLCLGIK
jgi:hypothetical protein